MEWFSLIVLGAIVTKLVGMMMDTLFDRRRRRQDEPLAAVQARRRHARRFFIAAVSCALYAWFALLDSPRGEALLYDLFGFVGGIARAQ